MPPTPRPTAYRLLLPLFLLLAGAWPGAALAGPRLVAPAEGDELVAGDIAVVEWGDQAPPGSVEWEAFLSVDGGRTYPLRITPHLDLAVQRFTFRVPRLPTRSARLLLRFGDEREEVEVETPQRFAIAAPRRSSWEPPPRTALSPGERARSREKGVVFWIEGARDGSGPRPVAAMPVSRTMRSVEPPSLLLMPLFWPARERTSLDEPEIPWEAVAAVPGRAEAAAAPLPAASVPVRLLIHRFNE